MYYNYNFITFFNLDLNEGEDQNLSYNILIQKLFDKQHEARRNESFKIKKLNEGPSNNDKIRVVYVDPLVFWKENEQLFPSLAKTAQVILGIPATSAMIESFFSKTGYIVRQHRRSMGDNLAENLFFSKENLHFA